MSLKNAPAVPIPPAAASLDLPRYLRVALFFAGAFLSFVWWDLVLRRVPGLGGLARRTSLERWCATAGRFRRLAVRLGGVLIKLGQFLSIRVDVLPPEVTSELSGLQDEVPAESITDIHAIIAAEFGRTAGQVFAWFSPLPEAAASLAQVHMARLPDGQEVVVKVQRPRIALLVETDLAAIRLAIGWLKLYRRVARRVDLDRLLKEFSSTTRAELDFVAEGKNAERFAADFAGDSGVYVARVYWDTTTRRVLTLENVASIKITDYAAIEAAGISRPQVARRLYDTYLKQIFANYFVHADPHPGNLFVRPLPRVADAPSDAPAPFLLIFVDFGMVAEIVPGLRDSLREVVIGIGLRDPHRVVQAYAQAGVLLPGADLRRLEELHEKLFRRMRGVRMGQLAGLAFEQAEFVMGEYRDLVYEMPFQFPTEVLFVGRAVGILSGMATSLDREFDPWAATIPFAEKLAAEEAGHGLLSGLDEIGYLLRLGAGLPRRIDHFLRQAERGEMVTQASLAPDAARALKRLERSVDRLAWAILCVGLLVAGTLVRSSGGPGWFTAALLGAAGLALIWGLTRR